MARAKNNLTYRSAIRLETPSPEVALRWNSPHFNKVTELLRPRVWMAIFAIPLGLATTYAGVLWYHVLVARGFGYIMDSIKYGSPFNVARMIVLCISVPALLSYPLVRHTIRRPARLYFVITLGFALGLLIVPEFLESYGPAPWWHF